MLVWTPIILFRRPRDSPIFPPVKTSPEQRSLPWIAKDLYTTAMVHSISRTNTDVCPRSSTVLTLAYIYHFNPNGILIDVIVPPEAFIPMRNGTESFSANSPPIFASNNVTKPANPTTGRQNNQGFEGLTISPDGKTLYVLLQSSLIQDGGTSTTRENTRFLRWDIKGKKWTGEWVVVLPFYNDNGARHIAAQSECHYLTDERFFVLARDSSRGYGYPNSTSVYRHVYHFFPEHNLIIDRHFRYLQCNKYHRYQI